uniref:Uncharacterized protein n=1 Tax=Anopheles coluzzii TaxID=1518534 RepID=A0A8W7Q0A4_ANOCL
MFEQGVGDDEQHYERIRRQSTSIYRQNVPKGASRRPNDERRHGANGESNTCNRYGTKTGSQIQYMAFVLRYWRTVHPNTRTPGFYVGAASSLSSTITFGLTNVFISTPFSTARRSTEPELLQHSRSMIQRC